VPENLDIETTKRRIANENRRSHRLYHNLVQEAGEGSTVRPVEINKALEGLEVKVSDRQILKLLRSMGHGERDGVEIDQLLQFCQMSNSDGGGNPGAGGGGSLPQRSACESTSRSITSRMSATQKSSFWEFNPADELFDVHHENAPGHRDPEKGRTQSLPSKTPARTTNSFGTTKAAAKLRRFIVLKEKYEHMTVEDLKPILARRVYHKMDEIEDSLIEIEAGNKEGGVVPLIDFRDVMDMHTIPLADVTFHKLVRPFLFSNDEGETLVDSHSMLNYLLDIFLTEMEKKGLRIQDKNHGSSTARTVGTPNMRLKHLMGSNTGVARTLMGSAQRARGDKKEVKVEKPRFGSSKSIGDKRTCITTGPAAAGYQFVSGGW